MTAAREAEEERLRSLSRSSPLLVFLRAMYGLMLDYGVYLPDGSDPIVLSKEQLVVLVERGRAEAPVRDLPALARDGLFRPLAPEGLPNPDATQALVLERRGARTATISEAVSRTEPEYPEWWEAPVPFALCARTGVKLNRAAAAAFGSDLERLSVVDLPEKDEFIVELEGRERPCYLTFRRVDRDVFIIDDCTGDLAEAQDISWWAAVGRRWATVLESGGASWRRADSLPEDFKGQSWPCEWQGRFLGYLCVEGLPPAAEPKRRRRTKDDGEPEGPRRRGRRKADAPKKEDEVLKAIGPQTMALLTPGQVRPDGPEAGPGGFDA